jgi:hypothetical protein
MRHNDAIIFGCMSRSGIDIASVAAYIIRKYKTTEDNMRIELDGTLVRMTPENDSEKAEFNNLWRILIDCVNKTRKLVPVGEYLPGIKEVGVFNIEE